ALAICNPTCRRQLANHGTKGRVRSLLRAKGFPQAGAQLLKLGTDGFERLLPLFQFCLGPLQIRHEGAAEVNIAELLLAFLNEALDAVFCCLDGPLCRRDLDAKADLSARTVAFSLQLALALCNGFPLFLR